MSDTRGSHPQAAAAGLLSAYTAPAAYDELRAPDGTWRDPWREFAGRLESLNPAEGRKYFERMRWRLRENGINHSIAGSPEDRDPHWELDPIPWLMARQDWQQLSAGLVQRAQLLNQLLADLYGPQEVLREGLIPSDLVFRHAGFLLPCHGIAAPCGIYLHLYAGEVVRGPDGQWLVLADRTQGPTGAGFAVENRIALSRTLAEPFQHMHVERLAPFFVTLREMLQSLAPNSRERPRVALLSPGPVSRGYFEDAYLARYLGYTLVEGGDLTVRGTRVHLKTLGGLLPVDVILRRVYDEDCDPLDLKGASTLGVPGLVQAVRVGQVLVANALGSGFVEAPALMALLPQLCRRLLGEELRLPSVPTWWCALPDDWAYVQAHFDDLIVRPALAPRAQADRDIPAHKAAAVRIVGDGRAASCRVRSAGSRHAFDRPGLVPGRAAGSPRGVAGVRRRADRRRVRGAARRLGALRRRPLGNQRVLSCQPTTQGCLGSVRHTGRSGQPAPPATACNRLAAERQRTDQPRGRPPALAGTASGTGGGPGPATA